MSYSMFAWGLYDKAMTNEMLRMESNVLIIFSENITFSKFEIFLLALV